MKKLKIIFKMLTKIGLLYFVFFILSPSLKVQAVFSDTANINMGIELKMGTVSLGQKNNNLVESVNYSGGDPVQIASSTLVNDGSLTGKLAYKIDIKKENNLAMTDEELKDVTVNIDFGTFVTTTGLNANNFVFVENSSGKEVVMEPDSKGEIPIKLSYKSTAPTKNEKITVKVTFRLIQSNATDANAKLFSDEKIIENTLTLVPKVLEPESYWPEEDTFIPNYGFSYSLEKMKMLFSEVYDVKNSNDKEIRNLNKAVLYIQFPENELVTTTVKENGIDKEINTFNFSNISITNSAIKIVGKEIDKANNGMKITFELIDKYNSTSSNALSEYANKDKYYLDLQANINKYDVTKNDYSVYYNHINIQVPFFATRLVLSSDVAPLDAPYTLYAQLPIKLTQNKKIISLKEFNVFQTNNPASAESRNFNDIQLNEETIEIEINGGDSGQISSWLNTKTSFFLWLNTSNAVSDAILNVKITGDTGNTLVISRKLENSLQSQTTSMNPMKIPLIEEETEEQTNQKTDTEKNIEEPTSTIDSTVPNESTTKVPIEIVPQEDVNDVDEEVVDSSSADGDAEIKEETVPIENSDQSTSEEKISDEQINE
ncbi:hypothetical protein [Carnobacterium inhibens]|uniref:Uncharacterized protein n=1 Tax=Carnobacterium inhibens TaxID=147709 RepID=A0ABR7TD23_9LACT|nr:hypothetical protein [Carnobacterium inhibens]MBC9825872.1 hypothetical protein [Carnobacterium inhibens]